MQHYCLVSCIDRSAGKLTLGEQRTYVLSSYFGMLYGNLLLF